MCGLMSDRRFVNCSTMLAAEGAKERPVGAAAVAVATQEGPPAAPGRGPGRRFDAQ
jgi:hypothetical protein